MNFIKSTTTPYQDLQGTAFLDTDGLDSNLQSLATDLGLDITRYKPVGIGIVLRNPLTDKINLSIYVVKDESNQGFDSFEQVIEVKFKIDFQELFEYFDVLAITLTEKNSGNIQYNVVDSKEISELD
jgi:hypothetical protein